MSNVNNLSYELVKMNTERETMKMKRKIDEVNKSRKKIELIHYKIPLTHNMNIFLSIFLLPLSAITMCPIAGRLEPFHYRSK